MTTIRFYDAWFAGLELDHKVGLLAQFAFEITLAGRSICRPGRDDATNLHLVREINETQHWVTGYLNKLLSGTCLDDFDLEMLDHEDPVLQDAFQHAWARAVSRVHAV